VRGNPFRTVDISNSGTRVGEIQQPAQVGEVIALQYEHREAPFEVVWVGSRSTGTGVSAGLRYLTCDGKIWGTALSQADGGEPLRRDMRVASSVQMKLLPSELPTLRTLEYSGRCIQARSVGGDYYDILDLAPGQVGFVLADIAGKGIPAALLMANLHAIVRTELATGTKDLVRALTSVNRHFYEHTESHRYATLFLARYDDDARKLHYINCGHNPPFLCSKGKRGTTPGNFDRRWAVSELGMLARCDVFDLLNLGLPESHRHRDIPTPEHFKHVHEDLALGGPIAVTAARLDDSALTHPQPPSMKAKRAEQGR